MTNIMIYRQVRGTIQGTEPELHGHVVVDPTLTYSAATREDLVHEFQTCVDRVLNGGSPDDTPETQD